MHSGDRVQDLLRRSLQYINGETQLDRWKFSAFLKTLGNRRNTDLEATSKVPRLNKELIFHEAYTVENCHQSNHMKECQNERQLF